MIISPTVKAQRLYDLLKEDNKNCYDVAISKPTTTSVKTYGPGGSIIVDFENRTIETVGDVQDMFGVDTKQEVAENFTTDNTQKILFFEFMGRFHASVTESFEDDDKLKERMVEHSYFTYLDLDKVFN